MSELRFEREFLGPRYWGNVALMGLIGIGALLPRSVAGRIGARLGDLFLRGNVKRRQIADTNLRLCFPELDEGARQQMLVEHFRAYGRSVIDLGLAWWASEQRLDQLCRVRGLEAWSDRVKAGERTLLVTPHTVGMDLGGLRAVVLVSEVHWPQVPLPKIPSRSPFKRRIRPPKSHVNIEGSINNSVT